ncbi:MAG TPA: type II toxin-antitoxin system RelE/ParE family toxin [Planctomycetota bacterium]|nr:type II toxin-antitoxin system RelE/ParE family toxin [Planctomycetota bacterium]
MSGYVLTPAAERDLDEIHDDVAADSPDAADIVVADLVQAFERVAEFPHSGHLRPELMSSEVRFLVVRPYLVVYRAGEQPIEILRIVSGHRDLVEELTWGVSEALELEAAYA